MFGIAGFKTKLIKTVGYFSEAIAVIDIKCIHKAHGISLLRVYFESVIFVFAGTNTYLLIAIRRDGGDEVTLFYRRFAASV